MAVDVPANCNEVEKVFRRGRGKPVLLAQGFGLAPVLDLPRLWTCPGFGLAPALDLPRLWTCSGFGLAPALDLIPIFFEIKEL